MKKIGLLIFLVSIACLAAFQFRSVAADDGHQTARYFFYNETPLPDEDKCVNLNAFCGWIENSDYRSEVPVSGYLGKASVGIGRLFAMHDSQWPSYDLPLDVLWDTMGIGDFIDKPTTSECKSGVLSVNRKTNSCIKSDGKFTRASNEIKLVSKPTAPVPFTITIPAQLEGEIRVTGGYVSLIFKKGKAPTLQSGPPGNFIFDDEIACLTIGATNTVIRGRIPTDKTHPVIIFK